jgi:hypothetical protein
MFSEPGRFVDIAKRLGVQDFRLSASEFTRFTQIAETIATHPVGQSQYGLVMRSASGSITYVASSLNQSIGVLVVRSGNQISSMRKVAIGVFKSQKGL